MTDTVTATGLQAEVWDEKFLSEYVRDCRFGQYVGTDPYAVIQMRNELGKKKGDKINFALVNRLQGAGVTGSAELEGNEEDMVTRSCPVSVDKLRNGVRISEIEEQKSGISLRDAARAVLKDWAMERLRDDVIAALASINGVAYATASEAQKDAWLENNADRVLFGATKANLVEFDHSASLANVDISNDKATSSALSLLKRMAKTGKPRIRPVKVKNDKEFYVVFAHPLAFKDLLADPVVQQARRDALERGLDNPIFTGGEIVWDGMIIREIEEMPLLEGVGAGGADVTPIYLCGAQAIGLAYAKRTTSVTQAFDYGDKQGVAIEEIRGVAKLTFGSASEGAETDAPRDHGVATWFVAVNPDV